MRTFALSLLSAVVLMACGPKKELTIEAPPMEITGDAVTGMITSQFAEEGCPWLVQITTRGQEAFLIPIALDEQYLKNGMRLRFTHRPSKASSGQCGKGDPAILENILMLDAEE